MTAFFRGNRARFAHSARMAIACATVALIATLAACASSPQRNSLPWRDARQLVLVTTAGWDATTGRMQRYERQPDGPWQAVGDAVPVTIGKSGSAWGIGLHPTQNGLPQKREGDGHAPAGVFGIGYAFGYAASAHTALTYVPMRSEDWCMDVPASPFYNRIVSSKDVGETAIAGSTEPMRRDLHADGDVRYKLGLIIEHNPRNVPGRGSCIFAHLWKSPEQTTAGCTAMAEPAMQELLQWLQPQAHPVFALLPQAEQARLATQWQLPAP